MSRPNEAQVSEALRLLDTAPCDSRIHVQAVKVLRAAVKPRPVWPAKEAAACLGVHPSNLGDLRGLPAPAQQFDRPSSLHPDKKMNLYFVDEIEEFAARRRAERGGT